MSELSYQQEIELSVCETCSMRSCSPEFWTEAYTDPLETAEIIKAIRLAVHTGETAPLSAIWEISDTVVPLISEEDPIGSRLSKDGKLVAECIRKQVPALCKAPEDPQVPFPNMSSSAGINTLTAIIKMDGQTSEVAVRIREQLQEIDGRLESPEDSELIGWCLSLDDTELLTVVADLLLAAQEED